MKAEEKLVNAIWRVMVGQMATLGESKRDIPTGWEFSSLPGELASLDVAVHNLINPKHTLDPMSTIASGLPKEAIDNLQKALGVSQKEVADMVAIPLRTLSRRETLPQPETDRVLRIGVLFQKALDVLGDGLTARRWLQTPKKAFGGQTPIEVARTEIGARRVEDLLGQLAHGVFA